MKNSPLLLTAEQISRYAQYLREKERTMQTVKKYVSSLNTLLGYLDSRPLTKEILISWKENLMRAYAPVTVNTILTIVNGFLAYVGRRELTVRLLKIQKPLFCEESRELTRAEYTRLVRSAKDKGNYQLSLVIQTICATGIRVSELQCITVDAVHTGRAEISNKGKRRVVFLPDTLCRLLKKYLQAKKSPPAQYLSRGRGNHWTDPIFGAV